MNDQITRHSADGLQTSLDIRNQMGTLYETGSSFVQFIDGFAAICCKHHPETPYMSYTYSIILNHKLQSLTHATKDYSGGSLTNGSFPTSALTPITGPSGLSVNLLELKPIIVKMTDASLRTNSSNTSLKIGLIVGLSVGGVILLIAIVVLVLHRRRKKKRLHEDENSGKPELDGEPMKKEHRVAEAQGGEFHELLVPYQPVEADMLSNVVEVEAGHGVTEIMTNERTTTI